MPAVPDDAAPGVSPSGQVQSVARAMDLLKAVAAADSTQSSVASLAKQSGLNRATAWRLLTTLEAQGMVSRDPGTGWFRLGPAIAELYAERSHQRGLAERARPLLERLSLETGEIACLGVVEGETVEYAAEVIPAIVDDCSWLGEQVVLHASSIGKAFLASVPPESLPPLLDGRLKQYTDSTITELAALEADLQRVRARGYAVCRGELEPGSWGVAAPVPGPAGDVIAFVCLWGPDRRGDHTRLAALGQLARRAARDLARV